MIFSCIHYIQYVYGNWVAVTNIMGLSVEINNRARIHHAEPEKKNALAQKEKKNLIFSGKWKQNFKLLHEKYKEKYTKDGEKNAIMKFRARALTLTNTKLIAINSLVYYERNMHKFFLHTILLCFFPTFAIWMESTHTFEFIRPLFFTSHFHSVNFVEV